MKKIFQFVLFLAISGTVIAQKTKPFSDGFLQAQVSVPLYDKLIELTGTGAGIAFQFVKNGNAKFKPQIDIAGNFFSTAKILVFENGEETGGNGYVVTSFAGFVYRAEKRFETGLSAGPAFHQNGTDLGIKPYAAFYLGKQHIIKAHTSLTHIFERNNITRKKNSGFISAGLAIKIF